jgi:benzylsuccinate CoA-transferase BbsF subunit
MKMNKSALDGVRIADFSWAWAGPYATMLLALMGAEVIKIESNQRLDHVRLRALGFGVFRGPDQSPFFNDLNLNKLSVTLNLAQPEAVELAKRIVSISDVVMQNMRPGVMDRLGLGYEELRKVRPDIIYLSSSACGATGPERGYVGYAPTFAALGGADYLTGYPDAAPQPMSGSIDLRSAATSAFVLLAALCYRQKTGEGQHIDLSSQETISVLLGEALMDYTMNRRNQMRKGNRDDAMAPHNCYRCRGGKWVTIAVATEEEWKAFCSAIGNPDWTMDRRFADAYSRQRNQDELDKRVEEWTINHTPYQVTKILQKARVAAFPSLDSRGLFNDRHLKERGFFEEMNHPVMGKRTIIAPHWRFSGTPTLPRRPAPLLGQHNEYVFGEFLGLSTEKINELKERKVIY